MSSVISPDAPTDPVVLPAAGWYGDPLRRWRLRYWDGSDWTPGVSDGTRVLEEPLPVDDRMRLPAKAAWLVLAGLVAGEVVGALLVLLVHLIGHSDLADLLIGQAGLWSGMAAAIVIASRRWGTGNILRDYGVRMQRWDWSLGLGASILMRVASVLAVLPVVLIFQHYFSNAPNSPQFKVDHGHAANFLALAAITAVGAPLIEEVLFRGLLMGALRRFGMWRAILAQGVIFGCVHMQPAYGRANFLVVVSIGVGGMGLGWLAWHYQRLGPGMWTHAFFNLQVVIGLAFVAFG